MEFFASVVRKEQSCGSTQESDGAIHEKEPKFTGNTTGIMEDDPKGPPSSLADLRGLSPHLTEELRSFLATYFATGNDVHV